MISSSVLCIIFYCLQFDNVFVLYSFFPIFYSLKPILFVLFLLQFDDAYVVYAWNDQDPTSPDEVMQHTNRGTKMINLMEETPPVQLPEVVTEFTLNTDNVSEFDQLVKNQYFDKMGKHFIELPCTIHNRPF